MNTTEHLVEAYYRQKGHFTVSDIKVDKGNNRQFDILTFDNKAQKFYHIEVSVTHALNWVRPLDGITNEVRFKFFGIPKNKRPDNLKTDFAKGKTYIEPIKATYNKYGIDYKNVIRVWCTWTLSANDTAKVDTWKEKMATEFNLQTHNFEILLFREEVLSTLLTNIGTANYDDELLRTLSLVSEHRIQTTHKK
jgi:hypothetical protein